MRSICVENFSVYISSIGLTQICPLHLVLRTFTINKSVGFCQIKCTILELFKVTITVTVPECVHFNEPLHSVEMYFET